MGIPQRNTAALTLRGPERSVFNQNNIGPVSRVTLRRPLSDDSERIWEFPSAKMLS